jgi:predicted HTH transcriptional regulator
VSARPSTSGSIVDERNTIEDRVRQAIAFASELPNVEFKRAEPFQNLKYRITKTALALANLRDGGLIIVGVRQEGGLFVPEGLDAATLATYEPEVVYEFVNDYASPTIELRLIVVEESPLNFAVIAVPPFERTPVVCRRNTPDGVEKNNTMRAGEIFVRTGSPISTSRVSAAAMMEDLLQLAAGRRAAETIRMLRAGGVALDTLQPPDPIQEEVQDIVDHL